MKKDKSEDWRAHYLYEPTIDYRRWVDISQGCGGHNGEYYYQCSICGQQDWIPHYGKVSQLNCKCNSKLEESKQILSQEQIEKFLYGAATGGSFVFDTSEPKVSEKKTKL